VICFFFIFLLARSINRKHGHAFFELAMERVRLAVYDLSNGMAAQLSPLLLGKQVRAIR